MHLLVFLVYLSSTVLVCFNLYLKYLRVQNNDEVVFMLQSIYKIGRLYYVVTIWYTVKYL